MHVGQQIGEELVKHRSSPNDRVVLRHEVAHRDHLYQRLIRLGLTHRVVTLMYSIFSILLGCLSLIYLHVSENIQVTLIVLVLILLFSGTQAVCIAEKK